MSRKNLGAQPALYPQPVLIVATYDADGRPNAMNAAWGGICGRDEIMIDMSSHKTTENIAVTKAFTVSPADVEHMTASDYVGLVSAKNEPEKMEKAGFTTAKSGFVNAPIINELPVALECELKETIDGSEYIGKIKNVILIVLPTYNNTSPQDSGDYGLALQLTNNFHNELLNDLMPAAEGKYSTYAQDTTPEGLAASRDHRGFGGFSMGSVNTWRTFQCCLDYFRYFLPMSGSGYDGESAADFVRQSGHGPEDFFIFAMSGTADFAYSAFKRQIDSMARTDMFTMADSEAAGNLAFREREGYEHDGRASNEYTYNGLLFFWGLDEF